MAGKIITVVFAIALSIAAPVAAPVAAALDPDEAHAAVLEGVAKAVKVMKSQRHSRAEINRMLGDGLRQSFDVLTMAKFALGAYRRGISKNQFDDYLAVFEDVIIQVFTDRVFVDDSRLHRDIKDIIRIKGAVAVGRNDLLVRTEFNRKSADWIRVDWRMRQRGDRPRIIDVIILGVSQAQLYRQEFASVIRRRARGVDGLITALREKSAQLRSRHRAGSE